MRILVVQNHHRVPAGSLGEALAASGAALDLVRADEGEALPAHPDGHDGLLVLGGPQDAWDDAGAPHFPAVLDLIRGFAGQGRPVLGICLGAQLAARAYGARVYRHREPEIGFTPVRFLDSAAADPLLHGLGREQAFLQWHYDTFDLPDGAVHLAANAVCENQAFRLGDAVWGLQFHPEATEPIIRAWMARHGEEHREGGHSVLDPLPGQMAAHLSDQIATAHVLAHRWLALAASKAPSR